MTDSLPVYFSISGAIMLGSWIVSLFFIQFWGQTKDRFFAIFALAFFLLGVERCALSFTEGPDEGNPMLYVMRLTAFVLIIIAIIDKNKNSSSE